MITKLSEKTGSIAPVCLVQLAQDLGSGTSNMTPLELYAFVKRAQEYLEMLAYNLRAEANEEFDKMASASSPGTKTWRLGDFATLTQYTPQGSWEFPWAVVELQKKADEAKAEAKKNKTAKYTPGGYAGDTIHFKVKVERI